MLSVHGALGVFNLHGWVISSALVNSGQKNIPVRFRPLILLCVGCWLWWACSLLLGSQSRVHGVLGLFGSLLSLRFYGY